MIESFFRNLKCKDSNSYLIGDSFQIIIAEKRNDDLTFAIPLPLDVNSRGEMRRKIILHALNLIRQSRFYRIGRFFRRRMVLPSQLLCLAYGEILRFNIVEDSQLNQRILYIDNRAGMRHADLLLLDALLNFRR